MTGDLRAALDPRSIAVIGASENPDKIGGRPIAYLGRFGFRGRVFPINPRRAEVQGHKSFPGLDALPEAPEMVIIAVPGEQAVAAVEACAAAGVKVAVMMASGFGETEGGKAQERAMADRARARGMRVVGPNSQGLANFGTGAIASFSSMFIEVPPADGPVAIVSQSGAMSVVPYGLLRERGIGVRHAHATGNDCDVTASELAAAVAADPGVELLLLYLESIADPPNLAAAAAVARGRGLPVIALKPGRTPAGQAAARSHTGALANEDRVVDAFLERHGIRRARDMAEMVDAAELYLKGWKPRGRRLVVISNSGASCVMAADAAEAAGMPIAKFSEETQAGLRAVLPSFAAVANPVDITAALLTNSRLFSQILPVIARDEGADAVLIGVPVAGAAYDVPAFARDAAAFAEATGKPVAIAAPQPPIAARFKAAGLPTYPYDAQAVAALDGFLCHHALMARVAARVSARGTDGAAPAPVAPPTTGGGAQRTLNEADSLALLAAAGVPVVPHRLCRTEDEAARAFADLGGGNSGRVAVKGCSADVAHKSEHGLVRLGLGDADAVRRAFRECREVLERGGWRFDGVLVAAMMGGGGSGARREMLIGAHRDPQFGPVVLIGDGGKYVEALPDTALLLPPFGEDDVRDALARLRIAPVLAGVRGERPADLAAFAHAAAAVGRLMLGDPGLASLDANPVMVGAEGEGCVAVDAVAMRTDGEEKDGR